MQPQDVRPPQVNPDISAPGAIPVQVSPNNQAQGNDPSHIPTSMIAPAPKSHLPIVPIVLAVIVGIIIIAASIAVFVTANQKPKTTPEVVKPVAPAAGRLSADDIENANKEIDKNLNNINDSTDFRSDDLTNQTLGLQ